MLSKPVSLLVINSHPIQYFAPLYRRLAADPAFDVTVLYCSQHGLTGEVDKQFGRSVKWDIPLLDGYRYEFLSNQSPNPSIHGFWGLLNLSTIKRLWRAPKSVVIVNGWASAVCYVAILSAWLFGHTVCMRGDSSHVVEQQRPRSQLKKRQWWLGRGLFRFIDYFLYIGQQNKTFYQFYGVQEARLIYCPFAVDNDRFRAQYHVLKPQRTQLRKRLGIAPDHLVVLFSGKYLPNKRPLDILQAVQQLHRSDVSVVLLGEGESRRELTEFIAQHTMTNVLLTGFVNQSVIGEYYAASDVYIMCSTIETWGLSTNEAMNFGVPVLLADTIGCVVDLVQEGVNGYSYPCGDISKLSNRLAQLLDMPAEQRTRMGEASLRLIDQYGYDKTVQALKKAFCPSQL
ncbi:glycosyltransferase family 4 protein [Fibrella forsythiae]|uniref:Glycosyltransferase family 4 protein n=1 Tax=Fibrella forsythiae TaxID=2817061 RepID=A0ABS3JQP1_9BACT|nr:glycosyltransferase family 4 protein [Fibrella forsythiae]MBO0952323.1 glycosyltransferase family 4 protein [Fibrella forsythiae]